MLKGSAVLTVDGATKTKLGLKSTTLAEGPIKAVRQEARGRQGEGHLHAHCHGAHPGGRQGEDDHDGHIRRRAPALRSSGDDVALAGGGRG
jgi:hypothetical protein